MTQRQGGEFRLDRLSDFRWSVLDGELPLDDSFPDAKRLASIRESSEVLLDPEVQQRAYFSGIFLYALEACNPVIFDEPEKKKIAGNEISNATSTCMYLPNEILEQDLTAITKGDVDPKEIPIMQAFRLMQERGGINHNTRRILDAVVRALYLRQEKINQE